MEQPPPRQHSSCSASSTTGTSAAPSSNSTMTKSQHFAPGSRPPVSSEENNLSHPHPELSRSEERSVGKECVSTCSSRWATSHKKTKNSSQADTNNIYKTETH